MTYADSETSIRGGKPVELYKFAGTYENYYYTTSVRKISFDAGDGTGAHDYLPVPMQRSEINAGTEQDDGLDITVDLPVDVPLIAVYGFESAPPDLELTIYRYHNPGEVIAYWKGPVAQIQTNDGVGTVQSISELATALSTDFPNVYYQAPCNNTLFDARCKVIEANYSGEAVLGAVNGKAISVDAIPAGASAIPLDGKLIGGEVRLPSGERRMIVSQAGVVIGVNFPFSRTNVGDTITITAGCNLAYRGDCKTVFNNQNNFGGFPFIGTDNPFTDTIDQGQVLPDNTCLPPHFAGWYWEYTFVVARVDTSNTQIGGGPAGFNHVGNWTWQRQDPVDHASGSIYHIEAQFGDTFYDGQVLGDNCLDDFYLHPCVYIYARHWTKSIRTQVNAPGVYIGRLFPFGYDIVLPAI